MDGLKVCFKCKKTFDYDFGKQYNCYILSYECKCPFCGYGEAELI